jgi:hypothetical protein
VNAYQALGGGAYLLKASIPGPPQYDHKGWRLVLEDFLEQFHHGKHSSPLIASEAVASGPNPLPSPPAEGGPNPPTPAAGTDPHPLPTPPAEGSPKPFPTPAAGTELQPLPTPAEESLPEPLPTTGGGKGSREVRKKRLKGQAMKRLKGQAEETERTETEKDGKDREPGGGRDCASSRNQ